MYFHAIYFFSYIYYCKIMESLQNIADNLSNQPTREKVRTLSPVIEPVGSALVNSLSTTYPTASKFVDAALNLGLSWANNAPRAEGYSSTFGVAGDMMNEFARHNRRAYAYSARQHAPPGTAPIMSAVNEATRASAAQTPLGNFGATWRSPPKSTNIPGLDTLLLGASIIAPTIDKALKEESSQFSKLYHAEPGALKQYKSDIIKPRAEMKHPSLARPKIVEPRVEMKQPLPPAIPAIPLLPPQPIIALPKPKPILRVAPAVIVNAQKKKGRPKKAYARPPSVTKEYWDGLTQRQKEVTSRRAKEAEMRKQQGLARGRGRPKK
jgi:hypothetical protein